jgi:PAS domain S-box-containing protein
MTAKSKGHDVKALRARNRELEADLRECRETLSAIRNGEIDALVVNGESGTQIFTLSSADQPYRVLVETMNEGAVTLGPEGSIVYCNSCFSEMIGVPLEKTIGASILDFISKKDLKPFRLMLRKANGASCKGEVSLEYGPRGEGRPTLFSMSPIQLEASKGVSLIVTDITEQRNLAVAHEDVERLKNIAQSAQDAISARDEFLTIASHELKTPITSLRLHLEMALLKINVEENRAPEPEKLRQIFNVSAKEVKRLTKLVEDLLDVSKIRAGRIEYNFEKVNLGEILGDIHDRLAEQLAANGNSVSIKQSCRVIGNWDRSRIDQVFVNLFSNILKYAPGSPVEVKVQLYNGVAEIRVKDCGPGIPKNKQGLIFERFGRAITSRNVSGMGLGLYIVRHILEAHGGGVDVESALGHGTTFVLTLPLDAKGKLRSTI